MSYGGAPYGGVDGSSGPPPGTVEFSGFIVEQFGTLDAELLGEDIEFTGWIDDHFGNTTLDDLTGGEIENVGAIDEQFGVTQFIVGNLAIYYGPLPTPLIPDAPYSQVFADVPDSMSSPEAMVGAVSRMLVPKQRIAPPIPIKGPPRGNDELVDPVPPETLPDMGYSRYKYVITDPLGNVQGEVMNCAQKTLTQILDNMCTATFTVYNNNPMIDYILANDCLCKVYRQPVDRRFAYRLMLTGDVVVDEEDTDTDTGTMTFSVSDGLNRLIYRLIGKEYNANTNHGTGFSTGTAANPKDIADTIGAMLSEVNSDTTLGHTGVTLGIRGPNTPSVWMEPVYFTAFTDQIALYTNTVAGVDFLLEPQEPYSLAQYPPHPGTNPYQPGGPPSTLPPQLIVKGQSVADTCIAKMNIYAPMGNFQQTVGPPGTYSKGRPYPVFEYGTGKHNVQSYQRLRSRASPINMWWNLPDGFPDSNSNQDPIIHTQLDVVTGNGTIEQQIFRRGGYEQVDTGDLGPGATKLRQQLANSEAITTANPQQQITFTPVINCDEDWTIDYFLGDVCTVRAYVKEANNGAGAWRFNGTMRIYGISATVDENDLEQIALTTIDPASAGISAPTSI